MSDARITMTPGADRGSTTTGFKMVFRRWAPGTDPASLPLAEMPKSIVQDGVPPLGPGDRSGEPAAGRDAEVHRGLEQDPRFPEPVQARQEGLAVRFS